MTEQATQPVYWAQDPLALLQPNPKGGYLPARDQSKVVFENSIARVVTALSVGAALVEKKAWPLIIGGGILAYRYAEHSPEETMPRSETAVTPVSVHDIPPPGPARNPTAGNTPSNVAYEPHNQPRMVPRGITNFQDALTLRGVDTTHTYGNMGGEIDTIFERPSRRASVMQNGWGEFGWRRNPLDAIDWERDLTRAPDDQRELQYTGPGGGCLTEH